jgi:hypothetical protein
MVHLRNNSDHLDEHLNVFNIITDKVSLTMSSISLRELAEQVLLSNDLDESRGNKFIDTGFSSDQNSKRNSNQGGVAMPNRLKRTGEPIFNEAMLALSDLCHLACQPKARGKVFVDPSREALCAGSIVSGNRIEALRVSLTNSSSNIVDCHDDNHNDTSEYFQGVINYSIWLLLSDNQWWRLSLIGYSRKSLGGFLRQRDLYMPLVERICTFYHQLPDDRKFITPALLLIPPSSEAGTGRLLAKRIKPHANKCVFYSIFVHCISRLQKKFQLSVWHVLALVTNSIVSETPEYFVTVATNLMKASPRQIDLYTALGPLKFGLLFYSLMFDLKERNKRDETPFPGQRHQPHYNKRQPVATVTCSILNF